MIRKKNNFFKLFILSLNQIPPVITFILALISLIISYQQYQNSIKANNLINQANLLAKEAIIESKEANKIAWDSKEIANTSSVFEKRQRSADIIDRAYEDIYNNEKYKKEIDSLIANNRINNINNFREIMDILENLGVKYCNGLVHKSHLSASFFNTLAYICDNNMIVNNFYNKKNSAVILCYELMPEGAYSKTVSKNALSTCQRAIE